jgi:hypothetical protein
VGDGLIALMDQKLSKLDDRLYELSSKISSVKIKTPEIKETEVTKQETKQNISKSFTNTFNFDKKETKIEPIVVPSTKSRQSFELTTLTNISKTEPKFSLFEKEQVIKPMPQPKIIQTELIKPKEEIVQEIIQPKPKVEDKMEIIHSVISKPEPTKEIRPDINKEVAKITEHKALPEPEQKSKSITLDDDFDDDTDDLDKIKGDIMKVLSKLDQAEVE